MSDTPLKDVLTAYAPENLPTDAAKEEYINLVKRELIKGKGSAAPTTSELTFFLQVCQSTGLNPITRQIYAIFRGGQMTIQTGIDGLRAIAERTGNYAGSDEGEKEYDKEGNLEAVTVTVYKVVQGKTFEVKAAARMSEYASPSNPIWKKMPYTMLEKCAEAKALRKAFPNIGQVYVAEEMHQAEGKGERKIIDADEMPKVDPKVIQEEVTTLLDKSLEEAKEQEQVNEN